MLYQCICCGRLFTVPDSFYDARGEHFGFPCAEKTGGCPYCGGAYTEVQKERGLGNDGSTLA